MIEHRHWDLGHVVGKNLGRRERKGMPNVHSSVRWLIAPQPNSKPAARTNASPFESVTSGSAVIWHDRSKRL